MRNIERLYEKIEKQMHDYRVRYTDTAISFTVNKIATERKRTAISCNIVRKSDGINLFISVQKNASDRWYAVKVEYYNFANSNMFITSESYTPDSASAVCDIIYASIVAFTL